MLPDMWLFSEESEQISWGHGRRTMDIKSGLNALLYIQELFQKVSLKEYPTCWDI